MRRFLPFAALLGVAFVLGCQDLGTGPVGLTHHLEEPLICFMGVADVVSGR